jgi:acetyl esterase/lipase
MSSSGSTDQVGLGKIWLHRPFNITPASTDALPNPSISHCRLPTKNPNPASENRWHTLYHQSTASALEHNLLSKKEFFKAQFSSRVTEEDAAKRIQKRRLRQSCSKTREVNVTIYLPTSAVTSNDDYTSESNEKLQGICLHVHGGGWIFGDSLYQVGHRCLEMSDALNAAVVSVEYTLTTSNNDNGKIFDPVGEVVSAIDWIETDGAAELNTKPMFVASGESSGAHLLLLSMLKCRDRPQRISSWKCLNLVYGFFDLSGTPSVHTDGNESSPISGDELLFMADMYCSKLKGGSSNDDQSANLDRRDPSISPLYANLSNLPPALFTVGSADPLLDDSLFLASRYCVGGNNYAELVIYEGGEHGIGHFGLQEDEEMGKRARQYTYDFMNQYLI